MFFVVGAASPALTGQEQRERTLEILTEMVGGGLLEAGDVAENGFVPWGLSPDATLHRIVELWDGLDHMPGLGQGGSG